MDITKRILCMLVILFFSITGIPVSAQYDWNLEIIISDTAEYLLRTVKEPQVGSIGGEWAVLGLARSDVEVPEEYYREYYNRVEKYVKEHGGNLHNKKYTEYSRLITALTSIGKNPADVAGYNLLTPLGDYEKTIWQGLNGPIWALISLDSGNYEMPVNPNATVQASREMYIQRILDCQLPDGGWSLFGGTKAAASGDGVSDPDITGMALQALSKYQDNPKVKQATDTALNTMSQKQDNKGGFSSWGTSNSESCVQILVALCELGIPVDDSRFVKNGYTIVDNLLTFYDKGNGFRHTSDGSGVNLMSTEQAFYGIVALKRMNNNKSSLYRMDDAISVSDGGNTVTGLEKKHADVVKMSIVSPGRTFPDIENHKHKASVEALASRNVINGKTDTAFEPDNTMTRAEFSAIIARGLGLPGKPALVFTDVTETDWYYTYTSTAYAYGIIKGISETEFNPNGTITREEAAVMLTRAAKLCGMDTEIQSFEARNILSEFSDYVKASDWSRAALAFCYRECILSNDVIDIEPKEAVTRAEIADMLYNMLYLANLI